MIKHGDIKVKFRIELSECIVMVDNEVRKIFKKTDKFSIKKAIKYANDLRNFYIRSGFSVNGCTLINGRDANE